MTTRARIRRLACGLLLAALAVGVGYGFTADAAERIAAIVNKDVILSSEVDDQTEQAAQRYNVDPADTATMAKLRHDVLEQLIEKQVILSEATRLGITVTPKDVSDAIDQEIDQLKERLGGDEAFRQALQKENTTEAELRKRYEPDIKDQLIVMKTVGREVQSKVNVTDAEVRAYYTAHKDSLGKKPESLKLAHILIAFEPDSAQLRVARQRADSIRTALAKGASFEKLAERFSDDPSGKRGGDLGTFGRGDMVAEFEDAAFKLKPMEISKPIRTRYGFHVIQVLEHFPATDSTEERIHARHIMIATHPSPADEERARKQALTVRDSLLHGADWAAMAAKYSADAATRDSAGYLGEVPVPSLPPNMREVLTALRDGEISTPFKRDTGYHIFKVLGREPESEYKFADIQDDLKKLVLNQKLEDAYQRWLEKLKKTVNIEIKE
ncbi:MAG: peptidylprolyl isomerase [Hyphomicrobiales bacterium]